MVRSTGATSLSFRRGWDPARGIPYPLGSRKYFAAMTLYEQALVSVQHGHTDHIDEVIRFLSARPRFHGSGYLAEKMLRYLSRPALTGPQRDRVIEVSERIASTGHHREAWEARKLLVRLDVPGWTAVHVSQSPSGRPGG